MWPISSTILNIPPSERVDLHSILKIAIVPGPSPPSNFDCIIEHVFTIINNINLSGGVKFRLEDGTFTNCAVAVVSSVFDLPAMAKFTKLPAGLKIYGCSKCTVTGKTVLDRVVYPPNIFGEERSRSSILEAVQKNALSDDIGTDTEGIRCKVFPAMFKFTRVISVHLDAMHIILNVGNKAHELLSGKRMINLRQKKIKPNAEEDLTEEQAERFGIQEQQRYAANCKYEQFALTNEEKKECDTRYRNMIITSDCSLICFIG